MALSPLSQSCAHVATPEEQRRDSSYLSCNAGPGEPCAWARRFDGVTPPPFHSERLEAAFRADPVLSPLDDTRFCDLLLHTGLV